MRAAQASAVAPGEAILQKCVLSFPVLGFRRLAWLCEKVQSHHTGWGRVGGGWLVDPRLLKLTAGPRQVVAPSFRIATHQSAKFMLNINGRINHRSRTIGLLTLHVSFSSDPWALTLYFHHDFPKSSGFPSVSYRPRVWSLTALDCITSTYSQCLYTLCGLLLWAHTPTSP